MGCNWPLPTGLCPVFPHGHFEAGLTLLQFQLPSSDFMASQPLAQQARPRSCRCLVSVLFLAAVILDIADLLWNYILCHWGQIKFGFFPWSGVLGVVPRPHSGLSAASSQPFLELSRPLRHTRSGHTKLVQGGPQAALLPIQT